MGKGGVVVVFFWLGMVLVCKVDVFGIFLSIPSHNTGTTRGSHQNSPFPIL